MEEWLKRTQPFFDKESFDRMQNKHLLICGLGGVGSIVFEGLVRLGIKELTIIDFDVVSPSNLNRQLLYVYNDIGVNKTDCAKRRGLAINPQIKINVINQKIDDELMVMLNKLQKEKSFDYIFDAIDDISAKVELVKFAKTNDIPLIASLGMGNRFDSTKVISTTLNKTHHDPLAKKFRYLLKQIGIDVASINVVLSLEERIENNTDFIASLVTVPSSSGLAMISHFLKSFVKKSM